LILAINAKGGEETGPKQKDRTPPPFSKLSNNFFTKGKKLFQLQKPSWQLRGELLQGSFYLAKGKAFEKGDNFQNLDNAF
jgi:hypothetical protein